MKLFCRVHPDGTSAETCVDTGEDGKSIAVRVQGFGTQTFTFDKVFGPTATDGDVYAKVGAPAVKDALEGKNVVIFTYGQVEWERCVPFIVSNFKVRFFCRLVRIRRMD